MVQNPPPVHNNVFASCTMATASTVIISADPEADFSVPAPTEEVAARVSTLLQKKHEKNDIFLRGFRTSS